MEYIPLDLVFWRKGRGKACFLISFTQNKIVKVLLFELIGSSKVTPKT